MSLGVFGVCGLFDLLVLDLVLHGSLWSCRMVGFVNCLWVGLVLLGFWVFLLWLVFYVVVGCLIVVVIVGIASCSVC